MNKGNWDMIAFATEAGSGLLKQLQDFAADESKQSLDADLQVDHINSIFSHANLYLNLLDVLNWKAKSRLGKMFKELEK